LLNGASTTYKIIVLLTAVVKEISWGPGRFVFQARPMTMKMNSNAEGHEHTLALQVQIGWLTLMNQAGPIQSGIHPIGRLPGGWLAWPSN
jgi:hypothetical protein